MEESVVLHYFPVVLQAKKYSSTSNIPHTVSDIVLVVIVSVHLKYQYESNATYVFKLCAKIYQDYMDSDGRGTAPRQQRKPKQSTPEL